MEKQFNVEISVTTEQGKGHTFWSRPQIATEDEVGQMKKILTDVSLTNLNFRLDDEQLVIFPKHTLLNSVIIVRVKPVEE